MAKDILSRYRDAEIIMKGAMSRSVVMNDAVFPHWIEGSNHFWYIRETKIGREYRVVDADGGGVNTLAFDHLSLAACLSGLVGFEVSSEDLLLKNIHFDLKGKVLKFHFNSDRYVYSYDRKELELDGLDTLPCDGKDGSNNKLFKLNAKRRREEVFSPDGSKSVFISENNLWCFDVVKNKYHSLTNDGHDEKSYGRCQYLHMKSEVQAVWSPDSRYIFTAIFDVTDVEERRYIQYAPSDVAAKPSFSEMRMSYPGDKTIESWKLVIIDTVTTNVVDIDYSPIPASGAGRFFTENMGWWSSDSCGVYFIDTSRDAKIIKVVKFDVTSGSSVVMIEESSETYLKLSHSYWEPPLIVPIVETNELIWFSERNGVGRLFLYDMWTGKLMHEITHPLFEGEEAEVSNEGIVRDILHFDPELRELLIQTAGRTSGHSPYYRDICKVDIDTCEFAVITSGEFDHIVYKPFMAAGTAMLVRESLGLDDSGAHGVSPSGRYVVTTRSRVDSVPVSLILDRDGHQVCEIEVADISGLPEGWQWPEPIKKMGADNTTDIYGVVFKPTDFDREEKYPIIDFSCSCRSFAVVPQGSFINGSIYEYPYFSAMALAALGFVVVAIEGRGTPHRSKKFSDYGYGDAASQSSFDDRIAVLRQLASDRDYMDLERVGLSGMDALATPVYGIFEHPDFYKVSVVHCFTDPSLSARIEGEMYEGISSENFSETSFVNLLKNVSALKGKLFLICGLYETGMPLSTFRLVEALKNSNKDFDMLCLPNLGTHIDTYALRRNWDYLVENLQTIKPPSEYGLSTALE